MDHSLQGCFLPQNTCKYCGAGAYNSYQHDENCLINVPIEGIELWRRGYKEQLAGKVRKTVHDNSGSLYLMGVACAAKLQVRQVPA